MTDPIKHIWASITPIIGMIIFVMLFIFGLFVFSYLLIIGAIVGLGLFIYAFIRSKLSGRAKTQQHHSKGRIIDHESTQDEKNFPHDKKSDSD
ncbi:hypothetical protein [Candidiatus Paracoxiella cheracis]|uniref:hypothetical protein n=1 Tax=Candidiatus Paracoxiella cheracis TaxID=3405120 RepID=UPI003BF5A8DD